MEKKTAIVTGGTSGIGLETAKSLSEKGYVVYAFSRHACPGPFQHICCDVSNEQNVNDAIKTVLEKEGRVDVLICNAGYGISGASEFTDNSDAKQLLDINLFGCVNCCKAIIPQMRAQKYGHIICISSVAGQISIPFQSWYSVSKAAVLSYASALRNEVAPFGITVTAVLPGDIKTGFTAARRKSEAGDDVYQGRISRSVNVMEQDEQNGMSPVYAGKAIAKIAQKRNPNPLYVIGVKYRFFLLLFRILPYRFTSFLVRKLYGG